jgi:23S rRNA pseudouridine1911/1915/1917 synthase
MEFKIIYEDENLLAIEKPAGITAASEEDNAQPKEKTLIDYLVENFPDLTRAGKSPRYGLIHRLDKETSGIILIAKNNESLSFFQKQFEERELTKKYIALIAGNLKQDSGKIETLLGRSPQDRKKQKAFLPNEPGASDKRMAVTEYKVLNRFSENCKGQEKYYTLVEATPKTGRKHQIRAHFSYLGHPLAGDKLYAFKGQQCPKELKRQFLHANFLKLKLPNGQEKELKSDLPEDLEKIIKKYENAK